MPHNKEQSGERMCFVVMPITDPDGYVKGHFKHVYEDIVRPACVNAGFKPFRADEVKQSNLIHLDILQKLLEAPMAVCDLSNRNPNVLFELALRQAFDKPVSLIQEVGTPQIFDISPLRYAEYRKERIYHEVLEDQKNIETAIKETFESHGTGKSINSIVKLLALSKSAALPEIGSPEARADWQQIILSELGQLRNEVRSIRHEANIAASRISRRELAPELSKIHDLTMRLEMLLAGEEGPISDEADMMLSECRHRLSHLMNMAPDEITSLRDHEMLADMRKRLSLLEIALKERRSTGLKTRGNR